jgi:hypothetical protein
MRDADTYPERAAMAMMAAAEGNEVEREAQLDAMDADDLRTLSFHAQILAVAARKQYLYRTTTPQAGP